MPSGDSGSAVKNATLDHFQHIQDVDESLYLAIQIIGGHILLPLLVLTILLKKTVNKHPVFVNFCVSWIFSSIVYSMLVYKGRSSSYNFSLDPTPNVCLMQASLVNGAQALTTCTSFALVAHLAYVLHLQIFRYRPEASPKIEEMVWSTWYNSILLALPFLAFVTLALVTFVIGGHTAYSSQTDEYDPDSNLAIPGVLYCFILQNPTSRSLESGFGLLRAPLLFSSIVAFVSLGLEVYVVALIYRNRSVLRGTAHSAWIGLILRVAIFSVYRAMALGLNLALILHVDEILLVGVSKNDLFNGIINFLQAAIPLVIFVVFSSRRDILDAWCFWKWRIPKSVADRISRSSQLLSKGAEKGKMEVPKRGEEIPTYTQNVEH